MKGLATDGFLDGMLGDPSKKTACKQIKQPVSVNDLVQIYLADAGHLTLNRLLVHFCTDTPAVNYFVPAHA